MLFRSTYNSNTIREYNGLVSPGSATIGLVLGVSQNLSAQLQMDLYPSSAGNVAIGGIGIDTLTAYYANWYRLYHKYNSQATHMCAFNEVVAAGYHYIAALQSCGGAYICYYEQLCLTGTLRM